MTDPAQELMFYKALQNMQESLFMKVDQMRTDHTHLINDVKKSEEYRNEANYWKQKKIDKDEEVEHLRERVSELERENAKLQIVFNNSSKKGAVLESKVHEWLLEYFALFENVEVVDTHKEKHFGDFLVHFKDIGFKILIDCKNYSGSTGEKRATIDSELVHKLISDANSLDVDDTYKADAVILLCKSIPRIYNGLLYGDSSRGREKIKHFDPSMIYMSDPEHMHVAIHNLLGHFNLSSRTITDSDHKMVQLLLKICRVDNQILKPFLTMVKDRKSLESWDRMSYEDRIEMKRYTEHGRHDDEKLTHIKSDIADFLEESFSENSLHSMFFNEMFTDKKRQRSEDA